MSPSRRHLQLAVPVLAILLVLMIGASGDDGAEPLAPGTTVAIGGLIPHFDPGESRYVSRCGRHGPEVEAQTSGDTTVAVGKGPELRGTMTLGSGVRPGEDFRIEVTDEGRRSSYHVRCLPSDFPPWQFDVVHGSMPNLLFAVSVRDGSHPWVIVFDGRGTPRWWYSPPTRALWAQVLRDGSVAWARSFGDGYGMDPRMAHEIRSPSGELLRLVRTRDSIVDGHELLELENGNFLVDSYAPHRANLRPVGGPGRAAVVAAQVEEIDPGGRVRWRWNSRRHIRFGETGRWWHNVLSNAKHGLGSLPTFDPVHINSIEPRGKHQLVISSRHTDAVYGIDRETGNVVWKLGGTETPQSLRVVNAPERWLFGGQHDARVGSDDTLTVHDNAKGRPHRPRILFFRLEPAADRAVYLRKLEDPRVKSSHCCGSARQLAEGGWLVAWGDNPLVTAFDRRGRIAFRLGLPTSTFRAVPVPPGATTLAKLDHGLERIERRG